MTIKYIIETTSSETDVNGNRYHFARITSAKTKNSLVIDSVGGDNNAPALLFQLGVVNDWEQVHQSNRTERIRDWQRMRKFATTGEYIPVFYEHELTARDLRRLNRKQA